MTRNILMLIAVLGVLGCSSSDEEPKGVIPQHQLDAMKKAENVEDVLQQAEDKRREQMDSN